MPPQPVDPPHDAPAAAAYCAARGWATVPIPYREKGPKIDGWQERTVDDVRPTDYAGGNIGIILGAPSAGIVDVDLDCPEAVAVAEYLLPPTHMRHGRLSVPQGHAWYVVDEPTTIKKYLDPIRDPDKKKTTLVELRGTGGQTVIPPSIHPTGEQAAWGEWPPEPAHVPLADLQRVVAEIAAAALLVRHHPGDGARHDFALALGGMLAHGGMPEARTERIVEAVSIVAGDADTADRLAGVADTYRRLAAGEPCAGAPTLARVVPERALQRIREWLRLGKARAETASSEGNADKAPPQAVVLVKIASDAVELWHHDGDAYSTVVAGVDDHHEHHRVSSRPYRLWLAHAYHQRCGGVPTSTNMTNALAVIAGMAIHDGAERDVHLRVAGYEGRVYLDLCDPSWSAIEIDAGGWRVVARPPVRFERRGAMRPLPVPVAGGRIDDLRRHVRTTDATWPLICGWLVGALSPHGPYPVLVLRGQHGSAKSSACRVLRDLIDPSTAQLRGEPREPRDLVIGALGSWVVTLDNVSRMTQWLSDGLCRLSTGGGYCARQLYTDGEEYVLDVQRPCLLNGITDVVSSSDLLDRALLVELAPIPDAERRTERELLEAWHADRPRILGALCEAVSLALRTRDSVVLPQLPRMADWCVWATAAEPAMGLVKPDTVLKALAATRGEAIEIALNAMPISAALRALGRVTAASPKNEWVGTAGDLLVELGRLADIDVQRDRSWPRTPRGLVDMLARLAPALRESGIIVERLPDGSAGLRGQRPWRLVTVDPTGSATVTTPSPEIPNDPRDGDGGDGGDGRSPPSIPSPYPRGGSPATTLGCKTEKVGIQPSPPSPPSPNPRFRVVARPRHHRNRHRNRHHRHHRRGMT